MRLLSEDAVIHNIVTYFMEGKKSIGQCLDETSTAYDLDRVVEQLENKVVLNFEAKDPCVNRFIRTKNEIIEECIEIVKRGGK